MPLYNVAYEQEQDNISIVLKSIDRLLVAGKFYANKNNLSINIVENRL